MASSRVRPRSLAQLLPALIVLAALAGGCATSVGPRSLPPTRFDYNQALASSWNEQLLLNLVRLRYRDTVIFLEVSSVISQLSVTGSAGVSGSLVSGGDGSLGAAAGVEYSDTPTVTYTPLQGEDFVKSLLEPIPSLTLMLLSQSGWSAERLLLCCTARIDELENAQSAAGPTPARRPRFERFRQLSRILRELQIEGRVRLVIDRSAEQAVRGRLIFEPPADDAEREQLHELAHLLGQAQMPAGGELLLTDPEAATAPGRIGVEGRSLLGVLFFLSQAVEVPEADERAGRVTVTVEPSGERFDWSELTGGVFAVRSSDEPPADVFVRVRYRGHWFYIADDDLDSKTTFNLLTYLFALQLGGADGVSPLITVSTGG